ncbi:MAG: hypothetical protein P8Y91_03795 [Desulfuromonadales bacterium]
MKKTILTVVLLALPLAFLLPGIAMAAENDHSYFVQGPMESGPDVTKQCLKCHITSNEPRCTSCHAGYGWSEVTFDFSDETKVDCLVCQDTTGTYVKEPTRGRQTGQAC